VSALLQWSWLILQKVVVDSILVAIACLSVVAVVPVSLGTL